MELPRQRPALRKRQTFLHMGEPRHEPASLRKKRFETPPFHRRPPTIAWAIIVALACLLTFFLFSLG
jgi:hypothetical protein